MFRTLFLLEFVTACMDQKVLITKTRLQRAFEMFDVDGSGKISSEELQKVGTNASRTLCV